MLYFNMNSFPVPDCSEFIEPVIKSIDRTWEIWMLLQVSIVNTLFKDNGNDQLRKTWDNMLLCQQEKKEKFDLIDRPAGRCCSRLTY